MLTLGIMALLIAQIRSSCGGGRSRAVAGASVAKRGLATAIPLYPEMAEAALIKSALLARSIGQNLGTMERSSTCSPLRTKSRTNKSPHPLAESKGTLCFCCTLRRH